MKPKSRAPEQDDLLRPRLTDMIDLRHELVKLAAQAQQLESQVIDIVQAESPILPQRAEEMGLRSNLR